MQINVKNKLAYRLQYGETAQSISNALNMDIRELFGVNGNINNLQCGDIIILSKSYSKCYIVKPLDTKEDIARNLGITVERLINYTKCDKFYIGQKIML